MAREQPVRRTTLPVSEAEFSDGPWASARLRSTPDATFWSETDGVYVSVHVGGSRVEVWDAYLEGLRTCYDALGVGHLVTDDRVDVADCSLVWTIHDEEWNLVGGARAVGPFRRADDVASVPAVSELAESTSHEWFVGEASRLISDGGLVELKGGWTARSQRGLGTIVGCFGWFCTWWFGVEHALATAGGDNNLARWVETGARRYSDFAPLVGYPGPAYDTEPVVWSRRDLDAIAPRDRALLDTMRRQLHPARERARGNWSPAELVFRPDRLAHLVNMGVATTDATADLGEQAQALHPPHPVGSPAGMPWVHLPWRNSAVRILGPDDFHRVRTDRNRHKLNDAELAQLRDRSTAIVGMSVGSSIAHAIAQEGVCGRLKIADGDDLELPNLNRLSASLLDLGVNKAELAARRISELDPYVELEVTPAEITAESVDAFVRDVDVVIEECDSLDAKVLVRERARAHGIPVVMETNDRGLLDIERFDLEPERPLFHGLVDVPDASELAELRTEDKVPFVLDILEASELSARTGASMVEIDRTVASWPQLASEVALGAALATKAIKMILLGHGPAASGRVRVDLDQVVGELATPTRAPADPAPALDIRPPLADDLDQALLDGAAMAPSGGNAQPWRFEVSADRFSVFESPDGVSMDVKGRATAVACGAALLNAACVAARFGRLRGGRSGIDTTLDLDRPDLAGSVRLGRGADNELASLVDAVVRRTTSRRLDDRAEPLGSSDLDRLERACAGFGGRAIFVERSSLDAIADVWAESDRRRLLTGHLHREMFSELKDPTVDSVDVGLDERTLELSPSDRAKLEILRRGDVMAELEGLDGGDQLRSDMLRRLDRSAGMLVVVAPGVDREAFVRGGIAMQRLWLEATRMGWHLQPVSPIFGYAHDHADDVAVLGADRAPFGTELRERAWRLLGIGERESFILSFRAHRGGRATAISRRRRQWASTPREMSSPQQMRANR